MNGSYLAISAAAALAAVGALRQRGSRSGPELEQDMGKVDRCPLFDNQRLRNLTSSDKVDLHTPGGPRDLVRLKPVRLKLDANTYKLRFPELCERVQRLADECGAPAACFFAGKDILCFPGEQPSEGAKRWNEATWTP